MAAAKPLKGASGIPQQMAAGDLITGDNLSVRLGIEAAAMAVNGTDWNTTAPIPTAADPTNAGLTILSADETTAQARGWLQFVPAGATQCKLTYWIAAATAPGATRYIRPRLGYRKIGHNAAVGSWATHEVGDLTVPTNAYWQRVTQSFNLSDPSTDIDADNLYQFELSFHNATTGTKLTGKRKVLFVLCEFC